MKAWIFLSKEGKLSTSDYNRASLNDWLKENPGRQLRLTPINKPVSRDLRAFYFGAIIPVLRSTCKEWEDLSAFEIHEIIKKMLFYFEAFNPKTKRTERFGRSVMADTDWNNTKKAMIFLDVVREYLSECGLDFPNAQEYTDWLNSAPGKDEKFSPSTNRHSK